MTGTVTRNGQAICGQNYTRPGGVVWYTHWCSFGHVSV
jgi:hypothetical protein